jgi:two-component system, NtrC family, sensor kinase
MLQTALRRRNDGGIESEPAGMATPRGNVLVVEDDPVLADITVAKLGTSGFVVRHARSAEDALSILRSGDSVDAVFSDVVLPGDMSGLQLARTVAAEFPAMAILLTSGFSAAFDVAQIRGLETLAKPYDYDEVADRLAQLIKHRRTA